MDVQIFPTTEALADAAAIFCRDTLRAAIERNGSARLVLSTGNSQLLTIDALLRVELDWTKVEMFHLDEYMGLSESHPASFRKYLKDKFTSRVRLKKAHFVDLEGDVDARMAELSGALLDAPVDLALIGIGENAHIAFNDPPADFETTDPFIVVELSDTCKRQQVREGWFPSTEQVPERAVSMSVHRIMQSRVILSCVPYGVKAEAIRKTMEGEVDAMVPASILKTHPDWHLYLDEDSASQWRPGK